MEYVGTEDCALATPSKRNAKEKAEMCDARMAVILALNADRRGLQPFVTTQYRMASTPRLMNVGTASGACAVNAELNDRFRAKRTSG